MKSADLRIVFAGTPEFAAAHLQALLQAGLNIVAVYTQPDRPAGSGQRLTPSAGTQLALQHALPEYQPQTLHPRVCRRASADAHADRTEHRRGLRPAWQPGRPWSAPDPERGQATGAAAGAAGVSAADPARTRGPGRTGGAAAGPAGGGCLWPEPAPGGTGYPATGLHQQPRLAAATLARCGAHTAGHRSR